MLTLEELRLARQALQKRREQMAIAEMAKAAKAFEEKHAAKLKTEAELHQRRLEIGRALLNAGESEGAILQSILHCSKEINLYAKRSEYRLAERDRSDRTAPYSFSELYYYLGHNSRYWPSANLLRHHEYPQ